MSIKMINNNREIESKKTVIESVNKAVNCDTMDVLLWDSRED